MLRPATVLFNIKLALLFLFIPLFIMAQEGQIKDARAKLNNGDTKGAIDILQLAAQNFPKAADVHYWLGMAYYKSGQTNEALNSALSAYSIKPKHLLNRNLLLDLYLKKERFTDAKMEADFLLNESPKDLGLRLKNAECLIGLDQFEAASIELSKLEVQKELSQNLQIKVLLLLGDVYARQRVNATAIAFWGSDAIFAFTHEYGYGRVYYQAIFDIL